MRVFGNGVKFKKGWRDLFSDFDQINVGDTRILRRTITQDDVRRFVEMTGDDNPLHVDPNYAETTSFKEVVVHGMLGASFISTVIGTQLPGPGALWVSQNLEFLLPVRLRDELTVSCTVLKKHQSERLLEIRASITNQNQQTVLTGVGKVKVLLPRTNVSREAAGQTDRTRAALVTGGSSGIGKAIALRLAADGHAVLVAYNSGQERANSVVETICANGGNAIAVKLDVGNERDIESAINIARATWGGIDLLINSASSKINAKNLDTLNWSDIQQQLDVAVKGAFGLVKAVIPGMMERRWGRVINLTSLAIENVPPVGWTSYTIAKSALAMLTRQLAVEYGPWNITANCVAPGMTDTPLIGDIPEKVQLLTARQSPLRRIAKPEDIAGAVSFLSSKEAQHITGHTLRVNGGLSM